MVNRISKTGLVLRADDGVVVVGASGWRGPLQQCLSWFPETESVVERQRRRKRGRFLILLYNLAGRWKWDFRRMRFAAVGDTSFLPA